MSIIWREGLLQIFRSMDAPGIHVAISGSIFNWGHHHFKTIEYQSRASSKTESRRSALLFMASYLLDVICARNIFPGMGLSWHVSELLFHVYFSILWENMYKKSYAMICDEFLAKGILHYFQAKFPKTFKSTKRVISRIGHWYLEEKRTYLRDIWSHWSPTPTSSLCTRPTGVGRNLLPDHFARL
jgi:hypothetical protein